MRVGLSWEPSGGDVRAAWSWITSEATQADGLGFDSVWIAESRDEVSSCPSPAVFLTFLARRTRSVNLRAKRLVTHANPVRIAEEIAVLDVFSRGRAGLALAAAGAQGVSPDRVHETLDFVTSAWSTDEVRYRGEFIRFPTHTPDDAPLGASTPTTRKRYVPQWEQGPVTPDFLAITPKPYAVLPPTNVEITDDETLEWAAHNGVSPLISAETPTSEAVERFERYRSIADSCGRRRSDVEPVFERYMSMDGKGDALVLGGDSAALIEQIRDIALTTAISHLVWRRRGPGDGDLYRFAAEVQLLLQA